jgi:hypothetical protein
VPKPLCADGPTGELLWHEYGTDTKCKQSLAQRNLGILILLMAPLDLCVLFPIQRIVVSVTLSKSLSHQPLVDSHLLMPDIYMSTLQHVHAVEKS